MDKYTDNSLVEPMDDIVLLNNNYKEWKLKEGYVGGVVENLIPEQGIILADFYNPITGEDIKILAEIKKEDFRVLGGHKDDIKIALAYRRLFKNQK